MQESGIFPEGIIADGQCYREFTLTEHQFRHTMALAGDPDTDLTQLENPVYYQAAVLAQRLEVPGMDKVTPDMVLNLSGADGQELVRVATALEQKRKAFRDAAQAATAGHGSPAQNGD
jgi:hypothetical protein